MNLAIEFRRLAWVPRHLGYLSLFYFVVICAGGRVLNIFIFLYIIPSSALCANAWFDPYSRINTAPGQAGFIVYAGAYGLQRLMPHQLCRLKPSVTTISDDTMASNTQTFPSRLIFATFLVFLFRM